jgi:hypothetical protein
LIAGGNSIADRLGRGFAGGRGRGDIERRACHFPSGIRLIRSPAAYIRQKVFHERPMHRVQTGRADAKPPETVSRLLQTLELFWQNLEDFGSILEGPARTLKH